MRLPPAGASSTVHAVAGAADDRAVLNGHGPASPRPSAGNAGRGAHGSEPGRNSDRGAGGGAVYGGAGRGTGGTHGRDGDPAHGAGVVAVPAGWRDRLAGAIRFARREVSGGCEADQFGFDPEFNARVLLPLARMFYRHWFGVRMRGLEHVPTEGPALVVANHSGTLPMDAIMLQAGLHDEHPAHRNLRLLGADLVYEIPLLTSLARKGGHTRACPANAHVLLRAGEVVGVFPEGFKGIGKPFTDRYQLRRFGRGGFAATAIRARVPIIPCAIVGAEEIYPMIANAKPVARLLGLPYFPITPLFPWLGPVGTVPLPSRWIIEFCPPVPTTGYEPGAEHEPGVVNDLSGRVRGTVQRKLDDLLHERGPAFG